MQNYKIYLRSNNITQVIYTDVLSLPPKASDKNFYL